MNNNRISTPWSLLAVLACLIVSSSRAAVSIDISVGKLYDASGNYAPKGALLILAADTGRDGFDLPTPGSFLGNDAELARWDVDFEITDPEPSPGTSTTSVSISLAAVPNLDVGDPLKIYWYPTLTTAATAPGAGTQYGAYRTDVDPDGSTAVKIAYILPEERQSPWNLDMLTFAGGGTLSEETGKASLSVVPEPSTYAMAAGIGCLAFGMAVRRLRQKA